jgi:tRNA-modifying protein YgfZ
MSSGHVFPRPDRAVLSVSGNDRTRFLQAMLSADVKRLPEGRHLPACLLDAKGRITAVLRVANFGGCFRIATDRSTLAIVLSVFEKHIVADDVTITDLTQETAVWFLLGSETKGVGPDLPGPGEIARLRLGNLDLTAIGLSTPVDPSFEIHLPASADFSAVSKRFPELSRASFDTLRIEAGEPAAGVDFGPESLLSEIPFLEEAVSYTKGCFLGQETLARLRARGNNVSRRLMGVAIPGGGGAVGSSVIFSGEEVGRITSLCDSSRLGSQLGLAFLPRSCFTPGTEVAVRIGAKEFPATVLSLPL